jgi:hypothetical protein
MDGTFAGKSELAAADVERVLPAGAHDRRWLACTKCIKCERKISAWINHAKTAMSGNQYRGGR